MKFLIRIKFFIAAFVLLLGITWIMTPRLLKMYIEENSVKLTGRKITLESIDVNYFTTAITHQQKISEREK